MDSNQATQTQGETMFKPLWSIWKVPGVLELIARPTEAGKEQSAPQRRLLGHVRASSERDALAEAKELNLAGNAEK